MGQGEAVPKLHCPRVGPGPLGPRADPGQTPRARARPGFEQPWPYFGGPRAEAGGPQTAG